MDNIHKIINQKQWWSPVWKGLVVDQKAKHYKQMGNAIWLFLYILLHVNRINGSLFRKIKTIARDMGISQRTIRSWLSTLKTNGYIQTRNTGRFLSIKVLKWKPASEWQNPAVQSDISLPTRMAESCLSQRPQNSRNLPQPSQKKQNQIGPNDIYINKDLLKNDIDNKKFLNSDLNACKNFKPKTKKELLAFDIAKSLNDFKALPLYLAYSNIYPENTLRQLLSQVKAIPDNRIKKSRGALFNYLIQNHDKNAS